MKLQEKLKKYFEDTGVQKKWFAEKIGMEPNFFYQIMHGNVTLPQTYWRNVIMLTRGKITFADLVEYYFDYPDDIEFKNHGKCGECKLSLRNFNMTTD